ncbi:MAG: insulinase family protein, partial [Deltaproteobacteria bacterium]|nr:insulinase family protein [Deltaproteobacteria bacterium]
MNRSLLLLLHWLALPGLSVLGPNMVGGASLALADAPVLPVQKKVLGNGMAVIVLQDSSIPSASLYLFFRVGSRNEVPGRTGLAHFFEHMMFNGAKKYGPGAFDQVMEAAGGSNNAFTTNDITVYTDWFPVQALDTVLELEADRVGSLIFSPDKVRSEREVVLQERRLRIDGDPQGALEELFNATTYLAHPYRWPVIGWESDIRAWTQEDLQQFHQVYYAPNNAVLVLVGDVQPEDAFARVEHHFGAIAAGPTPEKVRTVEPPQRGERRAELQHYAQLPALSVGYHVPWSGDASSPTMKVLETILMAGQSSRLYRRLVDRDQSALSVSGGYGEWSFDPTLFRFDIQLKGGHAPAKVEKALYEELAQLGQRAPGEQELRKAKNIILANLYRAQKTLNGKAELLGIFEIFHGGCEQLAGWAERIEAVDAEMVRDFTDRWLVPTNRTVVTLVPTAKPRQAPAAIALATAPAQAPATEQAAAPSQASAMDQAAPPAAAQPSAKAVPTAPPRPPVKDVQVHLPPYQRVVLANGLVLLLMEQHEVPLLHVQVMVRSGAAIDPPGKEGLADLVATLLRRGTKSRSADELAAAIDSLGATLGGSAGQEKSVIQSEFLVKDREQAVALLADVLQQPSFPQQEVAKELARMRDAVRQAKDEPAHVLGSYLAGFFYGPGHPYGRPVGGDERSPARIGRQDVVDLHRRHYVPGNVVVAMVGDLLAAEMQQLLDRHFGSWKGGPAPSLPLPPPPPPPVGQVLLVDKPDAPQAHFAFASPGIRRVEPDRTAVSVVNTLFGGRFGSWLNQKLRVEEGLTYGASS